MIGRVRDFGLLLDPERLRERWRANDGDEVEAAPVTPAHALLDALAAAAAARLGARQVAVAPTLAAARSSLDALYPPKAAPPPPPKLRARLAAELDLLEDLLEALCLAGTTDGTVLEAAPPSPEVKP